uniref:Uncharacterized protein n=1 Tax=Lactuca sativa TaxID=4236 RepID=A0A9R1UTV9_LACSA|nr:hypothetical protein LSAT_V11C800447450 [Lactuca sativa]
MRLLSRCGTSFRMSISFPLLNLLLGMSISLPFWSWKDELKNDAKYYVWDEPYFWKHCTDQIIRRCLPQKEHQSILQFCHEFACGGHFRPSLTLRKVLECGLS